MVQKLVRVILLYFNFKRCTAVISYEGYNTYQFIFQRSHPPCQSATK